MKELVMSKESYEEDLHSSSGQTDGTNEDSLEMYPVILTFRSRDVEREYLSDVAKQRWPVLLFIFCFDLVCYIFRFCAKGVQLSATIDGAVAWSQVLWEFSPQFANMGLLYSFIGLLNRRSSRLGSVAAHQEESMISGLMSMAICNLLASLTPDNASDYVYVAFFLICTSSFLKIRWWVGSAILIAPVALVQLWPGSRNLPPDATVHIVVAWGVGALMTYLADWYRRQTFANQKLAAKALKKEVQEARARIKVQKELAEAQAQAAQRALVVAHEKAANDAKSEFMSLMCHEVRTPLNGCLASAEMLLETPLAEEQRELANTIRVSGSILLSTVSNFLDFFKMEAGKQLDIVRQPVQLQEVVEDVHRIIEAMLGNNCGVTLQTPDTRWVPKVIYVDPDRLRGILLNLYTNAAKFTKTGYIHLRVRAVPHSSEPKVPDGYYSVRVTPSYSPDPRRSSSSSSRAPSFDPFGIHQQSLPVDTPTPTHPSTLPQRSAPVNISTSSAATTPDQLRSRLSQLKAEWFEQYAPPAAGRNLRASLDSSPALSSKGSGEFSGRQWWRWSCSSIGASSGAPGNGALYSTCSEDFQGGNNPSGQGGAEGGEGSLGYDDEDNCNWLLFEVVDTGVGIAEDELKALFKEFVQGTEAAMRKPRSRGGTGLGLSICAKQVSLLGGRIGAHSKLGAGSVFWFIIPERWGLSTNHRQRLQHMSPATDSAYRPRWSLDLHELHKPCLSPTQRLDHYRSNRGRERSQVSLDRTDDGGKESTALQVHAGQHGMGPLQDVEGLLEDWHRPSGGHKSESTGIGASEVRSVKGGSWGWGIDWQQPATDMASGYASLGAAGKAAGKGQGQPGPVGDLDSEVQHGSSHVRHAPGHGIHETHAPGCGVHASAHGAHALADVAHAAPSGKGPIGALPLNPPLVPQAGTPDARDCAQSVARSQLAANLPTMPAVAGMATASAVTATHSGLPLTTSATSNFADAPHISHIFPVCDAMAGLTRPHATSGASAATVSVQVVTSSSTDAAGPRRSINRERKSLHLEPIMEGNRSEGSRSSTDSTSAAAGEAAAAAGPTEPQPSPAKPQPSSSSAMPTIWISTTCSVGGSGQQPAAAGTAISAPGFHSYPPTTPQPAITVVNNFSMHILNLLDNASLRCQMSDSDSASTGADTNSASVSRSSLDKQDMQPMASHSSTPSHTTTTTVSTTLINSNTAAASHSNDMTANSKTEAASNSSCTTVNIDSIASSSKSTASKNSTAAGSNTEAANSNTTAAGSNTTASNSSNLAAASSSTIFPSPIQLSTSSVSALPKPESSPLVKPSFVPPYLSRLPDPDPPSPLTPQWRGPTSATCGTLQDPSPCLSTSPADSALDPSTPTPLHPFPTTVTSSPRSSPIRDSGHKSGVYESSSSGHMRRSTSNPVFNPPQSSPRNVPGNRGYFSLDVSRSLPTSNGTIPGSGGDANGRGRTPCVPSMDGSYARGVFGSSGGGRGSRQVLSSAPPARPDLTVLVGKRALLVEDNLINQTVARKMLTSLGMVCEVASNGKEAISAVEATLAGISSYKASTSGIVRSNTSRSSSTTTNSNSSSSGGNEGISSSSSSSSSSGSSCCSSSSRDMTSIGSGVGNACSKSDGIGICSAGSNANDSNGKFDRGSTAKSNSNMAGDDTAAACVAAPTMFDVVLMDMAMPVMGGVEATRCIRDLGVLVPILAMTANASDKDRDECRMAGMDGFLSKPVLKDRLGEAIIRVLHGQECFNERSHRVQSFH